MNMPSFYQDELFSVLSERGKVELRVVFARGISSDRLLLGWTEAPRHYPHLTLSGKFSLWEAARIAWTDRNRLHIVNGIWAEPSFAIALCVLALARSRFVVYAEAPEPRQSQAPTRALLQRLFGGWVGRRAIGMLAVSHFAEQFYIELGFDTERVFPFGYFRAGSHRPQIGARSRVKERTEVIFVGQLIHRKGVDFLLEAMVPLFDQHSDLFLSVVGAGIEAQALEACAQALGVQDRVNFEGTIGSDKIQARLVSADLLVLPSRWDGWGMVVNEALSAGVPVIASDRCGAADLVQHGVNGYVFRSEDVEDLRQCLRSFLENADARSVMRSAAANTGRAVSAEAVAPYLIECLKHMTGESSVRPVLPWLRMPTSQSASH
jgi:glycosyltransferase involved in cell wall biosynthesis